MYVYLKNYRIYHKSDTKKLLPETSIVECNFAVSDDLIYENWEIKLYEQSEQWKKDHQIEDISVQNEALLKENEELKAREAESIRQLQGLPQDKEISSYYSLLHRLMLRKCKTS
jgi:hypothetical protein